MKLKKTILVIDDKDQTREIENIQEDLNSRFEITYVGIWTAQPQFRKEGSNDPDINKLRSEIKSVYDSYHHFDLILSDFDLNAKGIVDGIDLIEYIKDLKPKAKILMYSGNYTDAVRKLIQNPTNQLTELQVAEAVSKFINYKLVDCTDRISYRNRTVAYFKENKEISIIDELIKLLYEHGDMTFNSCCPKYKGKKFYEIAMELERGNNSYTDEWVMAMIHQTIAYLVEVNNL
jgi:CheY-like chemotaxis protein